MMSLTGFVAFIQNLWKGSGLWGIINLIASKKQLTVLSEVTVWLLKDIKSL
jgi:hypothetical protein